MRLTIFILTLIVIGSNRSFGCVCDDLDYKQMVNLYDFVLIGRPTTNIHPDSVAVRLLNDKGYGSEVIFEVEKVIKGEIKGNQVIINQIGLGSCILAFKIGDKYLVFGFMKSVEPRLPGDLSPMVELDSLTGQEQITYVPFDNTSPVGDYIKTKKDNYDIVYTGLCGIYNAKTKFHKHTRKWRKNVSSIK